MSIRRPDLVTEDAFEDAVIQLAKMNGFLVHHARKARTKDGWRTPIKGDKGAPDLLLVRKHPPALIIAELKSERGRLTPEQRVWNDALASIDQATRRGVRMDLFAHFVWRPSDWEHIVEVLRRH